MSDADVAERARRALEIREAQALLDSLEPGSDQATKLLESAARKGIKLRVRHTLVDRTAIDALAEGLARDYARDAAAAASARRKKALALAGTLALAVIVAAAVVVASKRWLAPAASTHAPTTTALAVDPPLEPARTDGPVQTPHTTREAPRSADAQLATVRAPKEQCADAPTPSTRPASPPPTEPATEPTAPVKQIEPYFGTR
jgi:hypothetical protein